MALGIRRVIERFRSGRTSQDLVPLTTAWGDALGEHDIERAHPRPLHARASWWSLDGWWEYAFVAASDAATSWRDATPPEAYDGTIRVPFSPEASLSGVGRQLTPTELLWYRRSFACPTLPERGCCVLHFDGVDFACALYVNGSKACEHEGAYLPFEVDVTHLLTEGDNELVLCVFDPSEMGTQLRGAQRLERGAGHTAQSGIWQSVWLEVVPRTHVEDLMIEPDLETGKVTVSVRASGIAMLTAEVLDGEQEVASGIQSRRVGGRMTLELVVPEWRLWTPEDPVLYDVRVSYGEDELMSYFAFRSVGIEQDAQGVARFCLNHKPYFLRGVLDQGLWPDGLLTPPSTDAMAADLQALRQAGFSLVRKHRTVESERFYALCDRMGVLVLQDMPSGGDLPSKSWSQGLPMLHQKAWRIQRDDTEKGRARLGSSDEAYRHEWQQTCEDVVTRLGRHPCVIGWVLFSESWGQFDAGAMTQMVWDLDPTRPVVSASGWYDQGTGDIHAVHGSLRDLHRPDDPFSGKGRHGTRAQMVTESTGPAWSVEGHCSLPQAHEREAFESAQAWRAEVDELLSAGDALEAEGLSGFVYGQLTDVEGQTCGLITYDRRVNKLEQ